MADLLKRLHPPQAQYRDRRFNGTQEEFEEVLRQSTTVYVGNLSFFTTEEQIYEVCGEGITAQTRAHSFNWKSDSRIGLPLTHVAS